MKVLNLALVGLSFPAVSFAQTQIIIDTSLGDIPITLFDSAAPATVANFLGYVERGDYDNVIFHRLVSGFVLQTGGFEVTDPSEALLVEAIQTAPPVVNEPGISNLRGTIATAKLGGDPDSATSQWFVNLGDNSANLDAQNGGFTVFGEVTDFTVVDEITNRPVGNFGGAFTDLPLLEFDPNVAVVREDLIVINSVTVVPEPSTGLLASVALLGLLRRKR